MEVRCWEILSREKEHVPDVAADINLSMNKLFLNNLEDGSHDSATTEEIRVPPLNPLMLHAINLHKYANHVIETMKLNEARKGGEKIDLQVPQYNDTLSGNPTTKLNFTPSDFVNYKNDSHVEICELSKTVTRQILLKCVATLFAHIGYETSQQSAMDVLTDVLEDFLKLICHHIKIAIGDDESQQCSAFPHIIERILTEMGMGGVAALNDYYKSRIQKYINVLEHRCKELTAEYEASTVPKSPSPVDKFNKVVRVKVEEEDVIEVENPEVHFPTIDGDVNFSILETGYQLLNSLEAEANLHSMADSVEDITVTESPGIVLSSDDVSHLSPYNKKKRFK